MREMARRPPLGAASNLETSVHGAEEEEGAGAGAGAEEDGGGGKKPAGGAKTRTLPEAEATTSSGKRVQPVPAASYRNERPRTGLLLAFFGFFGASSPLLPPSPLASSSSPVAAGAAAAAGIVASVLPVSGSTRCVSPEARPRARTEEPAFFFFFFFFFFFIRGGGVQSGRRKEGVDVRKREKKNQRRAAKRKKGKFRFFPPYSFSFSCPPKNAPADAQPVPPLTCRAEHSTASFLSPSPLFYFFNYDDER